MAKRKKEKPKTKTKGQDLKKGKSESNRQKIFRLAQRKKKVQPQIQDRQRTEVKEGLKAKANVRFVRVSPRKVRLVINLIRGKNVLKAFEILDQLPQRSSKIVSKLLKSAVANAKQKGKVEDKDLFIFRIFANDGIRWKRIRPRAMGRADRYLKRTSHITVIIWERPKLKVKNYGTESKS